MAIEVGETVKIHVAWSAKVDALFSEILVVLIAVMLLSLLVAVLSDVWIVHNRGNVAYVDIEGSPEFVDWGVMEPNQTRSRILTLHNNGTVPESLNMTWKDLQPANFTLYATLSWDSENVIVQPAACWNATLELFMLERADWSDWLYFAGSSFNFTIIIQAVEVTV